MAVLTEGRHAAEFLLTEANGARSRETVTLAESQSVVPGAVLGKVTASGEYGAFDPAAEDGLEAAAGVALYAAATEAAETAPLVIIARDAEVNQHCLEWPSGITDPEKTAAIAQLAALGIIVR
jgi:hypothetical protein